MLSRRATTEILSRHQNRGRFISRLVQNEIRIPGPVSCKAPIIEKKLPKPGLLDPLQKLLRDDLIGINVHAIERCNTPPVHCKWLHSVLEKFSQEKYSS